MDLNKTKGPCSSITSGFGIYNATGEKHHHYQVMFKSLFSAVIEETETEKKLRCSSV